MAIRHDKIGMFWEDLDTRAKKGDGGKAAKTAKTVVPRVLPAIPDTGWRPPKDFPDLRGARVISIDTETKDPDLLEKGPGVRRGAHIVGMSVGTDDGYRAYFPIRHEVGGELNLPPENVMAWARDNLCTNIPKIGANLTYDLDFLAEEGVHVKGPFIDVQIAEPLIDENQFSYSLNSLGNRYLHEGKVGSDLAKWVLKAYQNKNYRADIWRAPPQLVGPYAEGDVDLPLRVWEKQKPLLTEQGLDEVFDIESRLIPMMLAMRRRGVRVDLEAAKRLDDELTAAILLAQTRLNAAGGGQLIDVNKNAALKILFDRAGVEYPRTAPSKNYPTGQPSFVKEWLEHNPHPACLLITEVRKLTKYRDTFIRGYILGTHINGRVHCEFHQMKGDENGTVSGRFSSSNPNLQNIPKRDKVWGPKIRALFIPEDGEDWVRHDWSQIEYRFLAHYGVGENGEVVRQMYRDDPETDFHSMVMMMAELERDPAKTVNFGLVYGMGAPELARRLGLTLAQAQEKVFTPYHGKVPFVKETYDRASSRAAERGYVKTILGRRAHFDAWCPRNAIKGKADVIHGHEKALAEFGPGIRRAYTHKALNRVLQGSSADLMKKSMVEVFESGIGAVLGVPLVTVHDELGHSTPRTKQGLAAVKEVKFIMENTVKLKLPVIAEEERGLSWGTCKKSS